MNDLLSTKAAAKYLGVSDAFLERDRWKGATIPFVRVGSRTVRYSVEDLQAYVDKKRELCGQDDEDDDLPEDVGEDIPDDSAGNADENDDDVDDDDEDIDDMDEEEDEDDEYCTAAAPRCGAAWPC